MASKPFMDVTKKSWYLTVKLGGKWRKVKLGKHPTPFPPSKPPTKPPREVADRAAELEREEWAEKNGRAASRFAEQPLADYVARYKAAFAMRRRPKSVAVLLNCTTTFLAFAAARKVTTVQGVTKALCRDFMEHRIKSGVSVNTVKTERGYLSPIMTRAVDDELVMVNPWKLVKLPGKSTPSDPVFWTSEEVGRIAAAAAAPWLADLVAVMANTGIRASAALSMRWDWLRWDAGLIAVPREHDKGGRGYSAPMTDVARDVLTRRQFSAKGEFVFPSNRGESAPVEYSTARRKFADAVKAAGVKPGTLHDLRHTFGRLFALVAPITAVQAALGHATLSQTLRYTKVGGETAAPFMGGFGVGGPAKPE